MTKSAETRGLKALWRQASYTIRAIFVLLEDHAPEKTSTIELMRNAPFPPGVHDGDVDFSYQQWEPASCASFACNNYHVKHLIHYLHIKLLCDIVLVMEVWAKLSDLRAYTLRPQKKISVTMGLWSPISVLSSLSAAEGHFIGKNRHS